MKRWLSLLFVFFPWSLRRWLLVRCLGYEIAPSARIGWSWVYPESLVLKSDARIGHLTMVKGVRRVELAEAARLGHLNWITGLPVGHSSFFVHQLDRDPALILGTHSAVTNRHLIDCTHRISIGPFATVAGFRSQLLTHSVDLAEGRQHSEPIYIGAYCFVGTACTLLGGSELPDYSVLGAASLLNKKHSVTHRLYAGVPAREIKPLSPRLKYFQRRTGYVH